MAVFDKDGEHKRIFQDIDNVCSMSGVPEVFLLNSAKPYLSEGELHWITKTFPGQRHLGPYGALLQGSERGDILAKFRAMAGVMLRHYIDARVITLNKLLEIKNDRGADFPDPSVLLIPDFSIATEGKPYTSWQIQQIYGILTQRDLDAKLTVLYVAENGAVQKHYGQGIALLLGTYKAIQA